MKAWLFERPEGLSASATTILRNLPVWKVWVPSKSIFRAGARQSGSSTVSAAAAVIVPKSLFLPNIRPDGPFIVEDREIWLTKLRSLGTTDVNHDKYIETYLVPYIISMPSQDANRSKALRQLLRLLSSHAKWRKSPLAKTPLFPNRKGDLCRAVDLYDPSQPVFKASFGADDSKFPDESFELKDLRNLGLNSVLTVVNFRVCVESIEREYLAGVSEALCTRAGILWKAFSDQFDRRTTWSQTEVAALAKYHFVPIRQSNGTASAGGYRHGMPVPGNQRVVLATMNEIIDHNNIPLAWTQKLLPEHSPPAWITQLFNLYPNVQEVVKHLVDLTTVVAGRCDLVENEFFQDLQTTYQYLSQPGCLQEAGQILKQQYPDARVWLNAATPIDNISPLPKHALCGLITEKPKERGVTIGSLTWLPANRFVEGILYDASQRNLHPIKASLRPYRNLIHAAGLNIVRKVGPATLVPVSSVSHNEFILQKLQAMRRSEDTCDMTIIIGRREHHVHLLVMTIFASYFLPLMSSQYQWNEARRRIIDLDEQSRPGPSTPSRQSSSPATVENVAAVIDWIYTGRLDIDDSRIQVADDSTIYTRLDEYLDILRLADFWDIPRLKDLVQNRILHNAALFIRIDTVREARVAAHQSHAAALEKQCQIYEDANKEAVERANIPEESVTAAGSA